MAIPHRWADSNLQSFKHRVKFLVTFLYLYSALAKQDAIAEIHFPILPSPSHLGSQAFILESRAPEGYMQEKKLYLISFWDIIYFHFHPTVSGPLLRACAAYFGTPSDLQEQIDHQGDDFHALGSYKHIPVTDPLLEKKLDIVISKWKMANQEFMDSKVSKSSAHVFYCLNFFPFIKIVKVYKLVKAAGEKQKWSMTLYLNVN